VIRAALPSDAPAIGRLHVRSWQTAYRGLLPDALLDELDVAQWTERRRGHLAASAERGVANWVAEEEGAVVGWAALGPARDEDSGSDTCELYALYLAPEHVGRGVGRALIRHCLAEAAAQGHRGMTLWVLANNARAVRFYVAAGFARDPRVTERPFADTGAPQCRMRRDLP